MLPDGVTAMEDYLIANDVVLSDVRVSPALAKDLVQGATIEATVHFGGSAIPVRLTVDREGGPST